MTEWSDGLCSNCSSNEHERCCSRCGDVLKIRRLHVGSSYCSATCERTQIREDKLSAAIEDGEQTARLNAATKRGLQAIRSFASVTVDNGIDMTGAEVSEMNLAIAWIDKHLGTRSQKT